MFVGTTLVNKAPQQWKLIFTWDAQKDSRNLASAGLRSKAQSLLDILRMNPFQIPPPYEKLVGDLDRAYSRRINIQHRLVYAVDTDNREVKILRMWTHYE